MQLSRRLVSGTLCSNLKFKPEAIRADDLPRGQLVDTEAKGVSSGGDLWCATHGGVGVVP